MFLGLNSLDEGDGRVSMSLEKIFCGESSTFLFGLWGLLLFLYGVSGAVDSCFVVRFNMACGALQCWLA
jgi:hypothetical protein